MITVHEQPKFNNEIALLYRFSVRKWVKYQPQEKEEDFLLSNIPDIILEHIYGNYTSWWPEPDNLRSVSGYKVI